MFKVNNKDTRMAPGVAFLYLLKTSENLKVRLPPLYKYIKMLTHSDTSRNLVPFVQFKKREKHPWRSGTYSTKVAG